MRVLKCKQSICRSSVEEIKVQNNAIAAIRHNPYSMTRYPITNIPL